MEPICTVRVFVLLGSEGNKCTHANMYVRVCMRSDSATASPWEAFDYAGYMMCRHSNSELGGEQLLISMAHCGI
jgi:hypothetical protein